MGPPRQLSFRTRRAATLHATLYASPRHARLASAVSRCGLDRCCVCVCVCGFHRRYRGVPGNTGSGSGGRRGGRRSSWLEAVFDKSIEMVRLLGQCCFTGERSVYLGTS